MNTVAQFMKVSKEQFEKDWNDCFPGVESPFDSIKLPNRATKGSAGYDFYTPTSIMISPGETYKFPTGIRAKIDEGWVLMMFPRSGLGFKYMIQLCNTVGVIDSDYYNADNEGHMFIKLVNMGKETVMIKAGAAVAQGVFMPFGIVAGDDADGIRTGGFGSTNK